MGLVLFLWKTWVISIVCFFPFPSFSSALSMPSQDNASKSCHEWLLTEEAKKRFICFADVSLRIREVPLSTPGPEMKCKQPPEPQPMRMVPVVQWSRKRRKFNQGTRASWCPSKVTLPLIERLLVGKSKENFATFSESWLRLWLAQSPGKIVCYSGFRVRSTELGPLGLNPNSALH